MSLISAPVQLLTPNPSARSYDFFSPSRRRVVLLLLSLTLVTAVLLRGIQKGEFSENLDETVHAATGLYVACFLRDLPLRHPVQYTYRYYAQYPNLGSVSYPPGFYIVAGAAFFILGPSVVTARLILLFFALFGLYFFVTGRRAVWTR
jgi:hypothetical protein